MSLSPKLVNVGLRAILAYACLMVCAGTLLSRAWAADTVVVEGSTLTTRTVVDGDSGEVYTYAGGSLPAGETLDIFKYLVNLTGPQGNTTGYITPLLFARQFRPPSSIVYVVAGIGRGFRVALSSTSGTIPFDVVEGIKVPTQYLAHVFGGSCRQGPLEPINLP